MKSDNEVIKEFNEYVNMTALELETWLKSDNSQSAGWTKDGGGGESVGHDSGRKIIEILKSNPKKNADKYTEEQIQHMRKVASYCKRHLAQEEKMIQKKTDEEVKKTKSYASLKNWGHDPLKNRSSHESEKEEKVDKEDEDDGEGEDKRAGDKRKAANGQTRHSKKRETRKGEHDNDQTNGATKDVEEASSDDAEDEKDEEQDEDEEEEEEEEDEENEEKKKSKKNGGQKSKKGPKPGETVSWKWGSGNPKGEVLDVKEEKTTITTKRGNKVSREGDAEDPAVVLDTGKSKAIKSNHELNES